MQVSDFIREAAAAIKDNECYVISEIEWLEILNWQILNLYPDVCYIAVKEVLPSAISASYIVDLSATVGLRVVSDILLELSSGNQVPYDSWFFDVVTKKLYLSPLTVQENVLDPKTAQKILISWKGHHPSLTSLDNELYLDQEDLELLKQFSQKEIVKRIMFDQTKLDRYRTLTGEVNIYTLLALERQLNVEAELQKRSTREGDIYSF